MTDNTINGRTPVEIRKGQSFSEYLDEKLSKVNISSLEDEDQEQKKRTPEETKKGLSLCYADVCDCSECPYFNMEDCDKKLASDVLMLFQQLESAQPKWISVEDEQKPKHGKEYLCVCSLPDDPKHEWDWIMVLRWYAYGTNGYVDRPHFTDEGLNGMIVTHWMERPKLPKDNA